ncbi:hypothetical protein HanXRQr2_Chr17g0801211 [Helianthus annuus]|uniref:Uncharacterized protein n=1 Tax=Helianthus annuus TaxID=4232 RepID=A0A251UAB7_HELAN|nr:uncharacterized protein LOC110868017 [Helianthus annuus]XP_022020757.1 uncharacterized protein LOC110920858 [Helianthus annuus]KAF5755298.1 hypothetical protein HanXRQr2_Chr17g0801211 [Helianthus annuus]KAJ0903941.1 hypothetical protein HanPSC8_Chr07g0275921 [Helianthus annuus]
MQTWIKLFMPLLLFFYPRCNKHCPSSFSPPPTSPTTPPPPHHRPPILLLHTADLLLPLCRPPLLLYTTGHPSSSSSSSFTPPTSSSLSADHPSSSFLCGYSENVGDHVTYPIRILQDLNLEFDDMNTEYKKGSV